MTVAFLSPNSGGVGFRFGKLSGEEAAQKQERARFDAAVGRVPRAGMSLFAIAFDLVRKLRKQYV